MRKSLHVYNDGFLSEVIKPTRGVAQGCGLSPLFFVLAIEVLALAIRDNQRIKGITIGGITKKINLLADDGLLALEWLQFSFNEVIQVLEEFGVISNLKINSHKSVIVPIGSRIAERKDLEGMDQFRRPVNGVFRYLGIDWKTVGRSCVVASNLDAEIETIKNIIRDRNSSQHVIQGRVLNVKSLMVSKLTYKFQALPSPHCTWFQPVQKLLNDYIWSQSIHHMVASRMYLPISQGGFDMVNVKLREKALKISWLSQGLTNPEKIWVKQCEKCLKMSLVHFMTCNIARRHVHWACKAELPQIVFDILSHWCDVHYTSTGGNIPLMPLAFNSALADRYSCLVFDINYVKKLDDLGLCTVLDFIEEFDSLPTKVAKDIAGYRLMNLMPSQWLTQADSEVYGDIPEIEKLSLRPFSPRACYSLLRSLEPVPESRALKAWEIDLECKITTEEWAKILNLHKACSQVRLQSFYIRYVNRAYTLNPRRAKWVSGLSTKCRFCYREDETFLHLFWNCNFTTHLMSQFITFCKNSVTDEVDYSRYNCLLRGFKNPALNAMFLICKRYIWVQRCTNSKLSFPSLLDQIDRTRKAEINAFCKLPFLQLSTCNKKWKSLKNTNLMHL